ncbi:Adenine DNA glycosylase [Mannheimia haemolytica]
MFPQFESLEALKRSDFMQNLQISQQLTAFRHTFSHFHLDITPVLVETDLKKTSENSPLVVEEKAGNYLSKVSSNADYWYDLHQHNEVGLATPVKRILDELAFSVKNEIKD